MAPTKMRTITMTGRTPVRIDEALWPVIASASDHDDDKGIESQAHRKWFIKVRQNDADGRLLVYGGYDTQWQHERSLRAGELLDSGSLVFSEIVPAVIQRVAEAIDAPKHLAQAVLDDLPAEEI